MASQVNTVHRLVDVWRQDRIERPFAMERHPYRLLRAT